MCIEGGSGLLLDLSLYFFCNRASIDECSVCNIFVCTSSIKCFFILSDCSSILFVFASFLSKNPDRSGPKDTLGGARSVGG